MEIASMRTIADNSSSYEMVLSSVMKKQKVVEHANYIWTNMMSNSARVAYEKSVQLWQNMERGDV